jgi:hypothetical protein
MADSVRLVIHLPNSVQVDSVRWSRRDNTKFESRLSSQIGASRETVAPIIEIFLLLLFVLVAVVAIVGCFVELIHLLENDALRHVAAKALQGGA